MPLALGRTDLVGGVREKEEESREEGKEKILGVLGIMDDNKGGGLSWRPTQI